MHLTMPILAGIGAVVAIFSCFPQAGTWDVDIESAVMHARGYAICKTRKSGIIIIFLGKIKSSNVYKMMYDICSLQLDVSQRIIDDILTSGYCFSFSGSTRQTFSTYLPGGSNFCFGTIAWQQSGYDLLHFHSPKSHDHQLNNKNASLAIILGMHARAARHMYRHY